MTFNKSAYEKQKIAERRAEFFGDKFCIKCGAKTNLVLHHKNPAEKEKPQDHAIWLWGKEKREKEIEKCIVVCSSCHSKIHSPIGQRIDKKVGVNGKLRSPLIHGTLSAYRTYKCRCDICIQAESKRVMSYRQ